MLLSRSPAEENAVSLVFLLLLMGLFLPGSALAALYLTIVPNRRR